MISAHDRDALEIERQARNLRAELRRLDAAFVHPGPLSAPPVAAAPPVAVAGPPVAVGGPPVGARGGEMAVAGALLVEILPVLPHLRALAGLVHDWSRRSRSTVKVVVGDDSIEINGATDAQTDRLIDLFVERHSR
ncbi:hypothetical protein GCM10010172_57730 [Paractinoplanes ferrugineus]|uniref:Uncharacterized protein n=1 Tax=Paractinoplanes ferrugineus TaxID=113564 RepID=A0A919J899_9ACTN|nr:hypothetical protein [Actinoplanes ferrugineus]GIE15923.1 hypothetical protein Afe05nite_77630 [Actinoplanes ferrugineus]